MPKQGGQGKGKPKLKDRGFGKALIRKQAQGNQGLNGLNTTHPKGNLHSMLDTSSLDDFVNTAIMDGRELEVKRVHKNDTFLIEPTIHQNMQTMTLGQYDYEHLKIPRKPAWKKEMTAEEIDMREREAFLHWRREIASMENTEANIRATPFEKNIEVWRQLWRVIEKSDIVVQIVDARNPLLYYSKDLMAYAKELSRPMLLLVNKADFLSAKQRLVWAQYLTDIGIKFAFYSAQIEQQKIDAHTLQPRTSAAPKSKKSHNPPIVDPSGEGEKEEQEEKEGEEKEAEEVDGDSEEDDEEEEEDDDDEDDEDQNHAGIDIMIEDLAKIWQNQEDTPIQSETPPQPAIQSEFVWGDGDHESQQPTTFSVKTNNSSLDEIVRRRCHVLNRHELIYFLTKLPHSLGILPQARHRGHVCVGLVGFPNVGKSSVINTILGVSKSSHGVLRVGVSSTPGKTKHFQTLDINEDLMLCDCPGLVFPSFMKSRGDMVCAGILPINQMRDYADPANIIATRVPQHLLEAAYGIHIRRELDIKENPNRPPTGSEFLIAYCAVKGFITAGTGRWDEFRACKEVLHDYNDGRILYVAPPPPILEPNNSFGITMDSWLRETESTMSRREIVANRLAQQKLLESDQIATNESQNLEKTEVDPSNQMVFGEGDVMYEFDPSETNVENESQATENTEEKIRREHKRLKHWGKKNRKLRDKNPYDDDKSVYIVHTTNRTGILKGSDLSSTTSSSSTNTNKPVRTRRQDPHYGPSHETSFIRAQPIPISSFPSSS